MNLSMIVALKECLYYVNFGLRSSSEMGIKFFERHHMQDVKYVLLLVFPVSL